MWFSSATYTRLPALRSGVWLCIGVEALSLCKNICLLHRQRDALSIQIFLSCVVVWLSQASLFAGTKVTFTSFEKNVFVCSCASRVVFACIHPILKAVAPNASVGLPLAYAHNAVIPILAYVSSEVRVTKARDTHSSEKCVLFLTKFEGKQPLLFSAHWVPYFNATYCIFSFFRLVPFRKITAV